MSTGLGQHSIHCLYSPNNGWEDECEVAAYLGGIKENLYVNAAFYIVVADCWVALSKEMFVRKFWISSFAFVMSLISCSPFMVIS